MVDSGGRERFQSLPSGCSTIRAKIEFIFRIFTILNFPNTPTYAYILPHPPPIKRRTRADEGGRGRKSVPIIFLRPPARDCTGVHAPQSAACHSAVPGGSGRFPADGLLTGLQVWGFKSSDFKALRASNPVNSRCRRLIRATSQAIVQRCDSIMGTSSVIIIFYVAR